MPGMERVGLTKMDRHLKILKRKEEEGEGDL
jgi:hypothetical protein